MYLPEDQVYYNTDKSGQCTPNRSCFCNPSSTYIKLNRSANEVGGYRNSGAVALSDDFAMIANNPMTGQGIYFGNVDVYARSGESWSRSFRLTSEGFCDAPLNSNEYNLECLSAHTFGCSIALDGNRVVVGSQLSTTTSYVSGSAYVFQYSGESWVQQARLMPFVEGVSNSGARRRRRGLAHHQDAQFGKSVASSGNHILVGAWTEGHSFGNAANGMMAYRQGAAYIFQQSGGTWSNLCKLTASDAVPGAGFGRKVAIEGEHALVMASDQVYVFTRSGTTWPQQTKLNSHDGASFDGDMAVNGDYAILGGTDPEGNGAAYIFVVSGTTWSQQAKLAHGVLQDYESYCYPSCYPSHKGKIAIHGNRVIYGNKYGTHGKTGMAHTFVRSGTTRTPQPKITASDAAVNMEFGHDVATATDYALISTSTTTRNVYLVGLTPTGPPPTKVPTTAAPTNNPAYSYNSCKLY